MRRRMCVSAVLSVLLLAALAANAHAAEVKLNASDGAVYDYFGISVAISGDYAVVGAYGGADAGLNSGSAYIFKRDGTAWTEQAKITASDGAAYDCFGYSVAISGDYAVVGAWADADNGAASGSAYIFKRDGTAWTEQAKITASDGAAYDRFGVSVAISGDYAVVGAHTDDDAGMDSGSAYIFKRDGTAWEEQAKITASDGAAYDCFGISVAISGDCAVVGASGDDDAGWHTGSAYIFKRDGTAWTKQAKITAIDGAVYDYFGISVAISGNCAVVGTSGDDDAGSNSGSAYIYDIPIGIFSCDSDGNPRNRFAPGETIYVTGNSLPASTSYKLWIQDGAVSVGDTLATGEDPSGAQESVNIDASGTLPVTAIWAIDPDAAVTPTGYDIVADNQDAGTTGTYHTSSDLLDSASTAGFVAPVPGTSMFTTADAGVALRIAVGSRPPDSQWDISGDGQVTSLDVLMIMQAADGAIEL